MSRSGLKVVYPPHLPLPLNGDIFLACTGRAREHRGAWWTALGTFVTRKGAERAINDADEERQLGSAIILLSTENLTFIHEEGGRKASRR